MIAGLDWAVIETRLDGAPAETRARVRFLLEGLEGGAMSASARAAREASEHG